MPILTVILVLVIVGLILWLVKTYVPMDAAIKNILTVVVIIIVIIWLLTSVFHLGSMGNIRIN
jgi:hypothetical protein